MKTKHGFCMAAPLLARGLAVATLSLAVFNGSIIMVQAEDYTYTTNNGTITITGYRGPGGAVSIPSQINGLPVTHIGDGALFYVTSLTSVTMPNSVTSIGAEAFYYCTSLTNVTLGDSVASIGDGAFSFCTGLTSIGIPSNVTNIGSRAFFDCGRLTAITVDALNAKYGSLDGVLFDKSLTTLIQYPAGKTGTSYTIPNSVTSIGDEAFYYCFSLSSITIDNSVTSIGASAFYNCYNLTSVTIGNSVTSIGNSAFAFSRNLASVTIGNSVTSIGNDAFQSCSGLTSVTIPNSVTSIGAEAFSYCSSLTNVTIGNSVTHIGYLAFSGSSLTAITVDALNASYASLGGVLFDKSQTTLIQYPPGRASSYTIPDSVTSIVAEAFSYCSSLTNVTIGKGVTKIGDSAFSGSGLTSVTIGNRVTSIGNSAFSDTWLTSVTIPNSVTSIGNWAFGYCSNLKGAYFEGNADKIVVGDYAFSGSPDVTVYYLPGTIGWGSTFGGSPTAQWVLPNPLILSTGPSFGIGTNGFGFIISWATNIPVVVEASTSLANPQWIALSTNTLANGWLYYSDPQWTNYTSRFYRIRAL